MGFILFVHVVTCVLLVIAILMQAGRGGGLTETFSSAESMFGTQTNKFMVRLTSVLAGIFILTSLFLAFNFSRKDHSLMTNKKLLPKATSAPAVPANEPMVKVSQPTPMDSSTVTEELKKDASTVAAPPITNATP